MRTQLFNVYPGAVVKTLTSQGASVFLCVHQNVKIWCKIILFLVLHIIHKHKKQKLAKENIQIIITKLLPHFPISQGRFEKKLHEIVYFKHSF